MLKNSILKFLKLDGFVENLTGYLETRVELLKAEVREDIAKVIVKLSFVFFLAFLFIAFALFGSIAIALWIAESLGLVLGFAILSGVYLLIAITFMLFKKSVSRNLEKKILEIVNKK